LPPALKNDLEAVSCRLYPAIEKALNYLRKFGDARMSGSGASVFVPCDTLAAAEKIYHQWPDRIDGQADGFVARSLLRHPHK
jgi:4-diphosphocytidyl-2-C-methyl-D-erythritol kinase